MTNPSLGKSESGPTVSYIAFINCAQPRTRCASCLGAGIWGGGMRRRYSCHGVRTGSVFAILDGTFALIEKADVLACSSISGASWSSIVECQLAE